jgi:hypothetical protein
MQLLEGVADRGYPLPYLCARLKARRNTLVRDWDGPVSSHAVSLPMSHPLREDLQSGLLREYAWVYSQMNSGLRKTFLTYFFSAELNTIYACLRYRSRQAMEGRVEAALRESLLSRPLKDILMEAEPLPGVLEDLEEALRGSLAAGGLRAAFQRGGLRAVEERLTDSFYAFALKKTGHPLLRAYFAYLVDCRNVLFAFKCLRWPSVEKFVFLSGGSLRRSKIEKALRMGTAGEIRGLALAVSGLHEGEAPGEISVLLLRGLLKRFGKKARAVFDVSFVLSYLIERSMEAMNLRTVSGAGEVEPRELREELVI